ncbi:MAG: hypothetical protein A3I66_12935 [Burkholderiales bacterium RIFCSPLOWO2_02_FULL_57_36]|nr:MAG: hypothetical protein A3I66_12935 [Burkholderiales bacterium RIFCSPLOWO2_02_FULL_57_36]
MKKRERKLPFLLYTDGSWLCPKEKVYPGIMTFSNFRPSRLGLGANIADDDALYAWCKTAKDETSNWPLSQKPQEHLTSKT